MHCNGYPFSGVMCILQLGLDTSILFFIEGKVVGWCVCVCVSGTTFGLTTSEFASPSLLLLVLVDGWRWNGICLMPYLQGLIKVLLNWGMSCPMGPVTGKMLPHSLTDGENRSPIPKDILTLT